MRRRWLAELACGGAGGFEQAAVGVGGFGLLIERVCDGVEFLCRGFTLLWGGGVERLGKFVESAGGGFEVGAGEGFADGARILILTILA